MRSVAHESPMSPLHRPPRATRRALAAVHVLACFQTYHSPGIRVILAPSESMMRKNLRCQVVIAATVLVEVSCGVPARGRVPAETGPPPVIPGPRTARLAALRVARAQGQPGDEPPS